MSSSSPGSRSKQRPAKTEAPPSPSEDESSELTTSSGDTTTSDDSDSDPPPPPKSKTQTKPSIVMGHEARKRPTQVPRQQKFTEKFDFDLGNSTIGTDTASEPSRATSRAPSEKKAGSSAVSRRKSATESSESDTGVGVPSGKATSSGSRTQSRSAARKSNDSSDEDDAEASRPITKRPTRRQSTTESTSSRQPHTRAHQERTPLSRTKDGKREHPAEISRKTSSSSMRNTSTRSDASKGRSRPTDPSDPERGAFKSEDLRDDDDFERNDCCGGNCGCCSGCTDCWRSCVEWAMWSWLRQKSAFIIGFLTSLGMIAIGGTGMMDWWVFASVGGYNLGGLGYCQGNVCTIKPAYTIEVGATNIFLRPRILSVLLLILAVIGILSSALFIWMVMNATWGETFTPPHTVFLCCFFNEPPSGPSEDEINRAGEDNGFDPAEWKSQSGKREMLLQVRVKDYFQKIMFYWVWPPGFILVGLSWIWVEASKAEEKLGFQTAIWGGMTMLVLYILAVNVYRPTYHRTSQQKISDGWDQTARRTKAMRARAATKVENMSETAVQRAKDLRHGMTPAGREEARRRRQQSVGP